MSIAILSHMMDIKPQPKYIVLNNLKSPDPSLSKTIEFHDLFHQSTIYHILLSNYFTNLSSKQIINEMINCPHLQNILPIKQFINN